MIGLHQRIEGCLLLPHSVAELHEFWAKLLKQGLYALLLIGRDADALNQSGIVPPWPGWAMHVARGRTVRTRGAWLGRRRLLSNRRNEQQKEGDGKLHCREVACVAEADEFSQETKLSSGVREEGTFWESCEFTCWSRAASLSCVCAAGEAAGWCSTPTKARMHITAVAITRLKERNAER